ncbi:MAG: S1 RNA-binding domain-containing protein [Candidatus Portnoybacteria bacterium]|nr:S1 RNA-binding domain-containing protein [Candidatus Portnoybacteria bacterium]
MEDIKKEGKMSQLLTQSPVLPKANQIVKGQVIEIGKNMVFIDLGAIGTGIILGREVKDNQDVIKKLKIGDEIFAMVLEPENENGFVELSLKAANKQSAWEELRELMQKKEPITTKITQANKGGLIMEIKGITGFMPVSQLSYEHYPRVEDGDKNRILSELNKFVNKEMAVQVIDLDQQQQKLIVSEKALGEQKLREIIRSFQIGDLVEGVISGVVDFGAFVRINLPETEKGSQTIEGLIHISEIDWQLIENPREYLKVGDKVQAKIIGIEGDRLSLSLKALKKDPWLEIDQKYQKGQTVKGKITKINPFGAFVQLDKEIHGLIHISEFGNEETMQKNIEIGQEYDLKIASIEPKVHKMALSLAKKEESSDENQNDQKEIATKQEKEL